MSETERVPVLVVGAGIIGLAIALRLRCAGSEVTLVDRQSPGRGCSFGNVGRIANECVEPLASPETLREVPRLLLSRSGPLAIRARYSLAILPWLLRFARASLPRHFERGVAALRSLQRDSLPAFTRLLDEADSASLLKTRGHLLVSENDAARNKLETHRQRLGRLGVTARFMNRHDVRQLAPELSERIACGLYFPDSAHVVDPYRVCRRLAQSFERRGGRLLRGDVRAIRPQADDRFHVDAGERRFDAATLVVAAGAWSRPLAAQLGHDVPLDTERGYHVTASGPATGLRLPVESFERHTVMTPIDEGLRITGFVELGGLELPANPACFDALRTHLHALLPSTEPSTTSEWMGFRPSLPDHLPVIGRCRRHPNAILAFGHQHLGLTLCGITAELVAALVAHQTPPVDPAPFDAARFA